jgi:hypothetical protein
MSEHGKSREAKRGIAMMSKLVLVTLAALTVCACTKVTSAGDMAPPLIKEIVDLSVVVAEDLPQHFWGTGSDLTQNRHSTLAHPYRS